MYREYKAPIGKELLSTLGFNHANMIVTMSDLLNNLFVVSKEKAIEVSDSYNEDEGNLHETHKEEFEGLTPEEADALYNQLVEELRSTYTQALLDEGYVLGEDIEVVIYE